MNNLNEKKKNFTEGLEYNNYSLKVTIYKLYI